MLKAENISAVRLQLGDGVEAVLVQDGEPWNTVRKYRCIAPHEFVGQSMLTVPNDDGDSYFLKIFRSSYGDLGTQTILMASPKIGAAIMVANAATSSEHSGEPQSAA